MSKRILHPARQMSLLLAFCAGAFLLWMLPALLAGYPFTFNPAVKAAHAFVQSGGLHDSQNPLFTWFIRAFLPLVDWRNALGWSALGARRTISRFWKF